MRLGLKRDVRDERYLSERGCLFGFLYYSFALAVQFGLWFSSSFFRILSLHFSFLTRFLFHFPKVAHFPDNWTGASILIQPVVISASAGLLLYARKSKDFDSM